MMPQTITKWTWTNPKADTHAVNDPRRSIETTDGWDDVLNPRGARIVNADGFLVRLARGDKRARTDLKQTIPTARFIGAEMAWHIPPAAAAELAEWRERWMPGATAR